MWDRAVTTMPELSPRKTNTSLLNPFLCLSELSGVPQRSSARVERLRESRRQPGARDLREAALLRPECY